MKTKSKKNQSGQSSVEFLLVSMIIVFAIFFHLTLSIVFMSSSFLDYAFFMTGRSVMAGRDTADGNGYLRWAQMTLNTYIRSDGAPQVGLTPPEGTFFSPFVTFVAASGGSEALDRTKAAMDPEQEANIAVDESRVFAINQPIRHLFYLGSFLVPGGGSLFQVEDTGITTFIRRDPAADECMRTMKGILDDHFGGSLSNLPANVGGLFDDGC